MHIKRFTGKTVADALKCVRDAFGEGAVILSTRQKGVVHEVVAAVDFDIEEIERRVNGEEALKNDLKGIREEMTDLKALLRSVMTDGARRDMAGLGPGALKVYDELLSVGVSEGISEAVVKAAVNGDSARADAFRTRCRKIVEEKTEVYNPLATGDSTRLLALVGPTGVGKTLTIAKLAARLRTRWKAKVGLISLEASRPGANEPLRQCAKAYGADMDTPASKDEFASALWRHKDKDVVFIDTPGKSPNDAKGIAALKHMLGAGAPIKTGLVLSCATGDDSQLDACRGFGSMPLDYLVFTKIDEARRFGSMLNCSAYTKRPIGFLCNGQTVPRDIDVATRETVGGLIMGGKGQ